MYKEALDEKDSIIKDNAQEISSIKAIIFELMKRVEVVEKEKLVNNESVSIKLFTLLPMYIFSH